MNLVAETIFCRKAELGWHTWSTQKVVKALLILSIQQNVVSVSTSKRRELDRYILSGHLRTREETEGHKTYFTEAVLWNNGTSDWVTHTNIFQSPMEKLIIVSECETDSGHDTDYQWPLIGNVKQEKLKYPYILII